MATEKPTELQAFEAGADLSAKQYYAVKLNSSGKIVLAGAGEAAIGVLQDDPTSGLNGTVMTLGRTKAIYGGSVTAGDNLMSDSAGKLVVATEGNVIIGKALESGSANEIHAVLLSVRDLGELYPVGVITFHYNLADIANGDILTNWTPGFKGRIKSFHAVATKAASTAAKAATLNLEINATNLTGGVLSLTTATLDAIGKVVNATAITADNVFDDNDTISIEATSVTAFAEGEVDLIIVLG